MVYRILNLILLILLTNSCRDEKKCSDLAINSALSMNINSIDFISTITPNMCEFRNILDERFFENKHEIIVNKIDEEHLNTIYSRVFDMKTLDKESIVIKDSFVNILSSTKDLFRQIVDDKNNTSTSEEILDNLKINIGIDINKKYFEQEKQIVDNFNSINNLLDYYKVNLKNKIKIDLLNTLNENCVGQFEDKINETNLIYINSLDSLKIKISEKYKQGFKEDNPSNCSLKEFELFKN